MSTSFIVGAFLLHCVLLIVAIYCLAYTVPLSDAQKIETLKSFGYTDQNAVSGYDTILYKINSTALQVYNKAYSNAYRHKSREAQQAQTDYYASLTGAEQAVHKADLSTHPYSTFGYVIFGFFIFEMMVTIISNPTLFFFWWMTY